MMVAGKRREMLKEDTLITSLYMKEVSIAVFSGEFHHI